MNEEIPEINVGDKFVFVAAAYGIGYDQEIEIIRISDDKVQYIKQNGARYWRKLTYFSQQLKKGQIRRLP
jgi:Zn/Cd-binding protein ZinT